MSDKNNPQDKYVKDVLGALIQAAPVSVPTVERTGWKWECSDEIRKVLESMGVFEEMEDQMRILKFSETKRDIALAKEKLDAIGKAMTILKSSAAIYKDAGTEDEDKGFDRVEIAIHRPDVQE